MFFFSATDHMDDAQYGRWRRLLARLAVLESRNPGKYLFHGTSAAAATKIVRDGFEPQFVPTQGPVTGPAKGVYWGTLTLARQFADRTGLEGGFPVIIVARTADVVAAGTPIADLNYLEDNDGNHPPHVVSWEESLRITGAIVCLDCRQVANMQIASSALPGETLARIDVTTAWRERKVARMTAESAIADTDRVEAAVAAPAP